MAASIPVARKQLKPCEPPLNGVTVATEPRPVFIARMLPQIETLIQRFAHRRLFRPLRCPGPREEKPYKFSLAGHQKPVNIIRLNSLIRAHVKSTRQKATRDRKRPAGKPRLAQTTRITSEVGAAPGAPKVVKSANAQSVSLTERIRSLIRTVYSRPAHLQWYCQNIGEPNLDVESAADDFIKRSVFLDVSPVRLFDPQWFRDRFPVARVNAFMSYITNAAQRLAPPSPLFSPRWYMRQHGLIRSAMHPFLDYLAAGEQRSPHPLLDVRYLREQSASWNSDSTALEFLQDQTKHRLRPHPLFDSEWYLQTNPDVLQAQLNPLQHYLYFGSAEQRSPNKFFNIIWYRDTFFDRFRDRQATRIEPLGQYVTLGAARDRFPGPGLVALTKASTSFTPHGPRLYCDCVEQNRNLYSQIVHRPEVTPTEFNVYFFRSVERVNRAFAENMVVLSKKRIALMYSAKSASAKILYWWLEQMQLLKCAQRFAIWSHEFEETFRFSREYIADSLTYDPEKYRTYKFVRHPVLRVVSAFTHMLMFPASFGLMPEKGKSGLSILEFFDLLQNTDLMERDGHCRPQLTNAEASGLIRPQLLKLEDGLESHFAWLEKQHDLPAAAFEREPRINKILIEHTKQRHPSVAAAPHEQVRFGHIPQSKPLLTPDVIDRIYSLYRGDFEAYGYKRAVPPRQAR